MSIPFQSKGAGFTDEALFQTESFFEVKTTGFPFFPLAYSVPCTCNPVNSSNRNTAPGSMVTTDPGETKISPVTRYGLSPADTTSGRTPLMDLNRFSCSWEKVTITNDKMMVNKFLTLFFI